MGDLHASALDQTPPDEGLGGVAPVEQVRANEGVEVAIENLLNVATLNLRPVILDELVGLHHVRTDLAAEADLGLRGIQLAQLRLPLFDFLLVEMGAEDLHGDLAVLVLAALVLALDDDPARQVGDAHGGFDLVDVLTAVASGPEGVDAEVLGPDHDVDAVVDFRYHKNRGERGVAPRRLVKRRDPNQTMHATFTRQHAVGVLALDLHGGRLDARLLAGGRVENGGSIATLLGPAQIHAQEHFRPIL